MISRSVGTCLLTIAAIDVATPDQFGSLVFLDQMQLGFAMFSVLQLLLTMCEKIGVASSVSCVASKRNPVVCPWVLCSLFNPESTFAV